MPDITFATPSTEVEAQSSVQAPTMAEPNSTPQTDPKSGYCNETKTCLRPTISLPPQTQPLSISDYVFSLLSHPSSDFSLEATTVFVDATRNIVLSYSNFLLQVRGLSLSLKSLSPLCKGQTAFILSPPSPTIPVLYFALMKLGIIVSPSNPLSSMSEILLQVELSKPCIAFATSATSRQLQKLPIRIMLLDSPEFQSMMSPNESPQNGICSNKPNPVNQSDTAAVLYSSGTTGKVKAVSLTHRNLIALVARYYFIRSERKEKNSPHPILLMTVPLFHVFGFSTLIRAIAMGETLVFMERFDFEGMLKAVEKYRITYMPVSPPLLVAMSKSDIVEKHDLSSLMLVGCGGAQLGKEVSEKFKARFPNVEIVQGYGLTETEGGATRMLGPDETKRFGLVGCLSELMDTKIVDPETGEALSPGQPGELWLWGPTIMKGASHVLLPSHPLPQPGLNSRSTQTPQRLQITLGKRKQGSRVMPAQLSPTYSSNGMLPRQCHCPSPTENHSPEAPFIHFDEPPDREPLIHVSQPFNIYMSPSASMAISSLPHNDPPQSSPREPVVPSPRVDFEDLDHLFSQVAGFVHNSFEDVSDTLAEDAELSAAEETFHHLSNCSLEDLVKGDGYARLQDSFSCLKRANFFVGDTVATISSFMLDLPQRISSFLSARANIDAAMTHSSSISCSKEALLKVHSEFIKIKEERVVWVDKVRDLEALLSEAKGHLHTLDQNAQHMGDQARSLMEKLNMAKEDAVDILAAKAHAIQDVVDHQLAWKSFQAAVLSNARSRCS